MSVQQITDRLLDIAIAPGMCVSNPGYILQIDSDSLRADLRSLLQLVNQTSTTSDDHDRWLDQLVGVIYDSLMDDSIIRTNLSGGTGRGLLQDSDDCQRNIDNARARLVPQLHYIIDVARRFVAQ